MGRERTLLQILFQDLFTHAAEANEVAVSLEIMLWSKSSLIRAKHVANGDTVSFFGDDEDEVAVDWLFISGYETKLVELCVLKEFLHFAAMASTNEPTYSL